MDKTAFVIELGATTGSGVGTCPVGVGVGAAVGVGLLAMGRLLTRLSTFFVAMGGIGTAVMGVTGRNIGR